MTHSKLRKKDQFYITGTHEAWYRMEKTRVKSENRKKPQRSSSSMSKMSMMSWRHSENNWKFVSNFRFLSCQFVFSFRSIRIQWFNATCAYNGAFYVVRDVDYLLNFSTLLSYAHIYRLKLFFFLCVFVFLCSHHTVSLTLFWPCLSFCWHGKNVKCLWDLWWNHKNFVYIYCCCFSVHTSIAWIA